MCPRNRLLYSPKKPNFNFNKLPILLFFSFSSVLFFFFVCLFLCLFWLRSKVVKSEKDDFQKASGSTGLVFFRTDWKLEETDSIRSSSKQVFGSIRLISHLERSAQNSIYST